MKRLPDQLLNLVTIKENYNIGSGTWMDSLMEQNRRSRNKSMTEDLEYSGDIISRKGWI